NLAQHLASTRRTPSRLASDQQLRVLWQRSLNHRDKILVWNHPRPRLEVQQRDVYSTRRVSLFKLRNRSHVQINVSRVRLQKLVSLLGVYVLHFLSPPFHAPRATAGMNESSDSGLKSITLRCSALI